MLTLDPPIENPMMSPAEGLKVPMEQLNVSWEPQALIWDSSGAPTVIWLVYEP